ncbi:MAG TPA: T9SS type A sorting domain-containing protein [Candidatus Deferrimicrobium sp.]|nr:T9SS type A sorting domain-containing protein [Candidatus Deferrimicrobium sp.]
MRNVLRVIHALCTLALIISTSWGFASIAAAEVGADNRSVRDRLPISAITDTTQFREYLRDRLERKERFGRLALGADLQLGGSNEPTVAVNPFDPLNIAVAPLWELRVSTDGGATFLPAVAASTPGQTPAGDPSLAFDSQGRLFWTYLGAGVGLDIWIAQCDPTTGAILPGYPVNVTAAAGVPGSSGVQHDKEWLAADFYVGSPFQDRLYVVWTEFFWSGSAWNTFVMNTFSTDQGLTWSAPQQLSALSEGFVWPSHNTVEPDGDYYVAYHSQTGFVPGGDGLGNPDGTTGKVFVCRSTGGGGTFPLKTLAYGPGLADITFNVQNGANPIPGTQFWLQGSVQPWILADPLTPNKIYVVANDDPDNDHSVGDHADVYTVASTDNGVTWSATPTPVNTPAVTPTGDPAFQVMPTAAINPTTGHIVVTYYDNRNGFKNSAGRFLLDVFRAISDDGGNTFLSDLRINDLSFDPDPGAGERWPGPPPTTRIGEYNGVATAGCGDVAVWCGNTVGGAPQQTIFDRYDLGKDAWIPDDPVHDIGNEPNNETNSQTGGVFWASTHIWVQNKRDYIVSSNPDRFQNEHFHENPDYATFPQNAPWVYAKVINQGCEPISGIVTLWWANASVGLDWLPVGTWWTEISQAFPGNTIITNLAPGDVWVIERQWQDIPPPSLSTNGHFCLLARFESTPLSDDPMAVLEGSNVWVNTYENNNIAWKNVTIVDLIKNKKSDCLPLIVTGSFLTDTLITLKFSVPLEEWGDPFTDHGQVYVDLGSSLFQKWSEAGGGGTGFEVIDPTILHIVDSVATITGVPMDSAELDTICVQFVRDNPPLEQKRRFQFNVIQYLDGGTNPYGGFTYYVDLGPPPNPIVQIEKTHDTYQGQHEYVDVTMESGTLDMGGFDILIAYDRSALNFQSAIKGDLYVPYIPVPPPSSCEWEYFTYRTWFWPSYEPHFFWAGIIRAFGLADLNNGPSHPICFTLPTPFTLFTLDFMVTDNRLFECQFAPIRFFWTTCNDNTISSVTGDTLFVADHVYSFEGGEITDSTSGFPTYSGVQSGCVVDPDGQGPKVPPLRFINFINGGVDIVCADSIDARGDINLNGVSNEIADAVLFTNYFIYGLGVFTVNPQGQIAATDVNADGLALTVGDLVYLVRIITGDAIPYPKLSPVTATWAVRSGIVSVNAAMGAAFVTVNGNVTPTLLADNMEMKYNYDAEGDVTRILVYSLEKGRSFSGPFLDVKGNVASLELATYDGAPVVTGLLPMEFALYQNFPNPFNPMTTISFALPAAADYQLVIYNLMGQEVSRVTGRSEAGVVKVNWDGSDYASGVYLYRLTAGSYTATKKMILLK